MTRRNAASHRPGLLACRTASLVLALAACAVAPPPEPAAVLAEALPATTRIPARWSSPADTAAVSAGWVASFNDPAMTALVNEALANNLDLKVAADKVDAAGQLLIIADAPLYPSVGVAASVGRIRDLGADETFNRTGGSIGAAWELDVWGRVRSGAAASRAQFEAAAEDEAFAKLSIAALVARSWFANSLLLQTVALSRRQAALYRGQLDLVREKNEGGAADDLDDAQAEASVNGAEAAILEAEARSADAIRSLEILLGRYPGKELEARAGFPRLPGRAPAGLPASLLARRPDVVAAERQVDAAFFRVTVAELSLLPSIDLTGQAGRLVYPALAIFGLAPDYLAVGATLLQPVFEGGALRVEIKISSAQQSAAVSQYGQTVLVAFKEVETALTNEDFFRRRLGFLHAQQDDLSQVVRLAKDQYAGGSISLQNLLQFQENLVVTEEQVIQARAGVLTNRIDLYLALGGGL